MPHSYYYDQWPPPEGAPQAAPICPARPRRSRKAALLFFATLAVLILITVLAAVLTRRAEAPPALAAGDAPPWAEEILPWFDGEDPFSFPDADGEAATTVERAPVGDGTTLPIRRLAAAEPLPLQEIYRNNIPSIVSVQGSKPGSLSLGTGVVLSEDGYIITNAHVIEGCSAVEIHLQDERAFDALLVGMDQESDLAVLKIGANDLTPAQFGDSDRLEVGDLALAIGNPLGEELRGTMTDGIISAINRDVEVDGRTMVLLQTTAALNSGNSGGALINQYGQVIGITTLKMYSYYDTIEGLGFAIPSTTVKRIVDELIERGYVSGRPVIGITVNTVPVETEDGTPGLEVKDVNRASAAWEGGLRPGDIILEANGVPTASMDGLETVKDGLEVGDALTLLIWRDGRTRTVEAAIMEQGLLEQ